MASIDLGGGVFKYIFLVIGIISIMLCLTSKFLVIMRNDGQDQHYQYQLGQFKIVALLDGHVELDLKNILNDKSYFAHPYLHTLSPNESIDIPINVYLIDTESRIILIDVGLAGLYNSASGNLLPVLKSAGYRSEQVTDILITHLHPDHVAGLLTTKGDKAFKNADLYISQQDLQYWLHEQQIYPDLRELIKKLIEPYNLHAFKPQQQLFDGVTVMATPGHSPGHSGFLFESEGKKLLAWGDIVHIQKIQFDNPNIGLRDDADAQQAINSRKALYEQVICQAWLVAGAHLDFPGLGTIQKIELPNGEKKYKWISE